MKSNNSSFSGSSHGPGTNILVGTIFILVGCGMLVGAYFSFTKTDVFLDSAVRAQGEIVSVVKKELSARPNRSKMIVFSPFVSYVPAGGVAVTFENIISSTDSNDYIIGQTVNVLYNPENPEEARIDNARSRWYQSGGLGGVGLFVLVIGFLSLRKTVQISSRKKSS